jgi:hypothetical protein
VVEFPAASNSGSLSRSLSVDQTKVIPIQNFREQSGMLGIKKRSGIRDFQSRAGEIEERTRISRWVVTSRIEESCRLGRMIAQSGGPLLRDQMRTAEQTRIRANAMSINELLRRTGGFWLLHSGEKAPEVPQPSVFL